MADQYATTTRRRLFSIPTGAVIGGVVLFAMILLIPGAFSFGPDDSRILVTLAACGVLSFAWLVGITFLWLPVWLWAERRRSIGWSMAAISGAAFGPLMSLVVFALMWVFAAAMDALDGAPYHWQDFIKPLTILASACSVVGLIVASAMWRIAYRRAVTPTVADTFD